MMSNFMIAYYGGNKPSSKEEGQAHMEKWKAWVADLGEAAVEISKSDPFLQMGGTIRVSQMMEMK